jgi:hypothetical protein
MPPATLQIVLQGGALGLVLILVGLFILARRAGPPAREFLLGLVGELKAQGVVLAGVQAQQVAQQQLLERRIQLAEERAGSAAREAAQEVIEVVRERASHTADEITGELQRLPTGEHPAYPDERSPKPSSTRILRRG